MIGLRAFTVRCRSARRWALLLACVCPARAAKGQGGPPLETDDPGTPGPGRVELNISVQAERGGGETVYDAPRLDANVGVGTRLQLKLELPWRVATAAGEPSRASVGNLGIGLKWRFAESGRLSMSTYPQVAFEGSATALAKGVADSGTSVLLPIEVAWEAGPVSLDAEVGYQRAEGAGAIVYGLAVAHALRPSLELLGECHGSGDTDLSRQGVLCGGGFRWDPASALGVLVALSAGVLGTAEDRPDRRLYTGVQVRW